MNFSPAAANICYRGSGAVAAAWIAGVLLMTVPAPPSGASESDAQEDLLLADFTSAQAGPDWYVVNDNVMGGRSEGGFRVEQGELYFAGRTNTDGGGFSSIRTKPVTFDLSEYNGIRVRVKGDGRRYTWRLTTDARWRGQEIGYWADFEPGEGAWRTVNIPFSRFVPRYRGTRLDGPELDPARITGMGLMIYDNLDGAFELRLASVHAYSAQAPFALEQYRWKHRVLLVSAPAPDDTDLVEVQKELAATRDEFADRDMVLVTLLDSGPSMAGDRELSVAETAAARAVLEIQADTFALRLIGKDGSVKLARDAAVPMPEIFSLVDTMPMRQREMSDR
jgi:NADH dehydrogenase [ubiquinone] 1 alpha subcomplex assembly factor 1